MLCGAKAGSRLGWWGWELYTRVRGEWLRLIPRAAAADTPRNWHSPFRREIQRVEQLAGSLNEPGAA